MAVDGSGDVDVRADERLDVDVDGLGRRALPRPTRRSRSTSTGPATSPAPTSAPTARHQQALVPGGRPAYFFSRTVLTTPP